MKRVILKWTEVRVLEVPDETPTKSVAELSAYLDADMAPFCIQMHANSHEIVDVLHLPSLQCKHRKESSRVNQSMLLSIATLP